MELLQELIRLPMPFIVLAGAGLILWPLRRARRALFAISALGLLLSGVPVLGKIAFLPQWSVIPSWSAQTDPTPIAIVVPTAGIFLSAPGRWSPSAASVARLTRGLALRDRIVTRGAADVALVLVGGQTGPGRPAEAEVLMAAFGLDRRAVLLDTVARDSDESATAVRGLLAAAGQGPLLVVTDTLHMACSGLSLRREGFEVYGAALDDLGLTRIGWDDFIPRIAGLAVNSKVIHSYAGLAFYFLTGRLSASHLFAGR